MRAEHAAVLASALVAISSLAVEADRDPGQRGRADAIVVAGVVIDGATGMPIPGARITARAAGGLRGSPPTAPSARRPPPAAAMAGPSGQFRLTGLPGGVYRLQAASDGYVGGGYGQVWPSWPSQSLEVKPGGENSKIRLSLWRSASISGTVLLTNGRPAAGSTVQWVRIASTLQGARLVGGLATTTTDVRGAYRLTGLMPGRYLIRATASGPVGRDLRDLTMPHGPGRAGGQAGWEVYYPAALLASAAQIVELQPGEQRTEIAIHVPEAARQGRSISGIVTGLPAQAAGTLVRLLEDDSTGMWSGIELASADVDRDGSFRFSNIPPGRYLVKGVSSAKVVPPPDSILPIHRSGTLTPAPGAKPIAPVGRARDVWFSIAVEVGDQPVDDLMLAATPGARVTGAAVIDPDLDFPATALPSTAVVVRSLSGWNLDGLPAGRFDENGTFTTPSLPPGRYFVSPWNYGDWFPDTTMVGGRDVKWEGVEVGSADVSGVAFRLTRRRATVQGTIRDATGAARPDALVFFFPPAEQDWQPGAFRVAYLDQEGSFAFESASGEYVAVGVVGAIPEMWQEPSFLRWLVPRGKRIKLAPGGRQTVALTPVSVTR